MEVRKSYRIAALILLCVSAHVSSADPASPVSAKVAVLNEVAQALGSLGDAIVKITDGVSAQDPDPQRRRLIRQPRQLIRKAEEYCFDQTDQPLRIGQLCREIGVSERTLDDTFCRLTGMSPLTYLKGMQLNRVYRALRDADPGEVLIKQVAITHGFLHTGQFSHDYKRLFGQLPLETLRRC